MAEESRSTEEVLSDHWAYAKRHEVDQDLEDNYAEDVVLFTTEGLRNGHDGLRAMERRLKDKLGPQPSFSYDVQLVHGDVGYLEWSADGPRGRIRDGADAYVVREGEIVAQTIHYTVEQSANAGETPP